MTWAVTRATNWETQGSSVSNNAQYKTDTCAIIVQISASDDKKMDSLADTIIHWFTNVRIFEIKLLLLITDGVQETLRGKGKMRRRAEDQNEWKVGHREKTVHTTVKRCL